MRSDDLHPPSAGRRSGEQAGGQAGVVYLKRLNQWLLIYGFGGAGGGSQV